MIGVNIIELRNRLELWEGRRQASRRNVVTPGVRTEPIPKHKWTWACPATDCRGFLDDNYVCGACKSEFCRHCNEEKHTIACDPDKKKSIQFLKKDSRPCPGCATVIHKIDGCDQMWCPDCQTAFSWKHGTIETHTVHNPHYYQYLRDHQGFVPRTPGDGDECQQERMPVFPRNLDNECAVRSLYHDYFRVYAHGFHHISAQWNDDVIEDQTGENNLKFLRVQYLAKDISKDQWKRTLQRRYKAVRKCNAMQEVLRGLHQVGLELFWDDDTEPIEIIKRAHAALLYFNKAFELVSNRFNCIAPYFDPDNEMFTTMKYPKGFQHQDSDVRM